MKIRNLLLPVALFAAIAAFGGTQALAQEDGPPPTSGKVLASGLQGTIGATIGPDGALYVAEGGSSGTQKFATPDGDGYFGLSGRVTRIDPVTGAKTTFATGIPSGSETSGGDGFGLADAVFIKDQLYYLITGSFNLVPGLEAYPNGVYKVNKDGTSSLVADLSKFNDDNPVTFPDAGPGGNPFGLTARAGLLYVTDGNYNRVLRVNLEGDINIVSSFENVVTTGITSKADGPLIVTEFGGFPFDPESGKVIQVGVPSGTQIELANGYSHIISAAYGPGGKLYALSMGGQAPPDSGDEALPFTGKILSVNADGTMTPIVDGLMLATSLDFSGDTAYVTSLTGMVYQIASFSSIEPLTPAPTAPPPPPPPAPKPPTGITAPDTGSGPDAASNTELWVSALAAVALGTVGVAGGLASKRR